MPCKAGQCGCCKHVAALLFTLLDYTNMELKSIPATLTCTQVAQKWHQPLSTNMTLNHAAKFSELVFEKAEVGKTKKRSVCGTRDAYCATPPCALKITEDDLKTLTNNLKAAGKAALFCGAVASNYFKRSTLFETSSSLGVAKLNEKAGDLKDDIEGAANTNGKSVSEMIFENIVQNYGTALTMEKLYFDEENTAKIKSAFYVDIEECKRISTKTTTQSESTVWYAERSRRLTASLIGKIMNRRKRLHPTSLIKSILEKRPKPNALQIPASLRWGLDNEEVAIQQYQSLTKCKEIGKCGFVINPKWPWLGCSPDGVVIEGDKVVGCVEVKCPYAKKDLTLRAATEIDNSFFLNIITDKLTLTTNHNYHYQCQGVMNILELPWLDFIVYTTTDCNIERIFRDNILWGEMMQELSNFYAIHIIPEI